MSATPTTREVLVKAREFIATPEKWTTEAFARSKTGRCVEEASRSAVCFCSIGAIGRAAQLSNSSEDPAADMLRRAISVQSISKWNDWPGRTHAEVLEAFDKAIALASTEASQ